MRKWVVTLSLIIVMLTGLCICVYAEDITDLQNQSNELTQELNESNNRLKAIQDQISDSMKQLEELDTQIAESQTELDNINVEIDDLITQIGENETKLEKVQKEYDNLQDLLETRLIEMYKAPKLHTLDVLVTSKSITEFISNYYAMKDLINYDRELLETVKNQKNEIETTKKILQEKKQQVITSRQTQQKKSQVLANTKTMRQYYLSQLTGEEQELQAKIDQYNAEVAEIEAEIKLLALNSISSDYIGGAMLWPVPGYTRLTSTYGMRVHPITGAYKLHTGIDISAPLGTSFIAAANGIVSKATYNAAYGNMVIIDHGGGVQTLYAHGDQILVQLGQTVAAGTEVLKVGSTGYSTGPHAHFEIRINGQTVDPLNFLLNLDDDDTQEEETLDENSNETETNTNTNTNE